MHTAHSDEGYNNRVYLSRYSLEMVKTTENSINTTYPYILYIYIYIYTYTVLGVSSFNFFPLCSSSSLSKSKSLGQLKFNAFKLDYTE